MHPTDSYGAPPPCQMQGQGRGCGEGPEPGDGASRGENTSDNRTREHKAAGRRGEGRDGRIEKIRGIASRGSFRRSGGDLRATGGGGQAASTRAPVPQLRGGRGQHVLRASDPPRQAPVCTRREQISHPGRAGLGRAGGGRHGCQPLAMLVMSALPAPEVKGAAANHSPSVLPAGIRQRREEEPRSQPNKSLFARASLAARAPKQRVLRADCFSTIIFSRRRSRVPRPAEALKASRCLDPAGL